MTERFAGIRTEAVWGKAAWIVLAACGVVVMCALAGCESQQSVSPPEPPARIEQSPPPAVPLEQNVDTEPEPRVEVEPPVAPPVTPPAPAVSPKGYAPSRIEILPLSELVSVSGPGGGTQLDAYVSLLDAFGSQIKAPGTLRFELYEYVRRSADPKGQTIAVWPDIDLTDPAENNRYWQDFLRAYAFELSTDVPRNGVYILEATCIRPDGRRLSADFTLRPEP